MPKPFRTELSARTEGRRRFLIDLLYTGVWIAFLVLARGLRGQMGAPFLLASPWRRSSKGRSAGW